MVIHFWSLDHIRRFLYLANKNSSKVKESSFFYKLYGKVYYINEEDNADNFTLKRKSQVSYVKLETKLNLCINNLQHIVKYIVKLNYTSERNEFNIIYRESLDYNIKANQKRDNIWLVSIQIVISTHEKKIYLSFKVIKEVRSKLIFQKYMSLYKLYII